MAINRFPNTTRNTPTHGSRRQQLAFSASVNGPTLASYAKMLLSTSVVNTHVSASTWCAEYRDPDSKLPTLSWMRPCTEACSLRTVAAARKASSRVPRVIASTYRNVFKNRCNGFAVTEEWTKTPSAMKGWAICQQNRAKRSPAGETRETRRISCPGSRQTHLQ
jgi:hypothetical protein